MSINSFMCKSVENEGLGFVLARFELLVHLLLLEKHLFGHEIVETLTVSLGRNAADCISLEDRTHHVFYSFLLAKVRQNVNDAHEIYLCAIR